LERGLEEGSCVQAWKSQVKRSEVVEKVSRVCFLVLSAKLYFQNLEIVFLKSHCWSCQDSCPDFPLEIFLQKYLEVFSHTDLLHYGYVEGSPSFPASKREGCNWIYEKAETFIKYSGLNLDIRGRNEK